MKYLPAILLAGSAMASAPAYAQTRPPARAQQTTAPTVPAAPSAPVAQDTQPPSDDVFARARRLMAAGQEDAGRALVQSELNSSDPGSARYVEALYWRAVLARTAADAERDLRVIVIDYPLSAQSDDALMRLAQLEMTRGENDQAMRHLQRVVREHAHSPSRPRASFWMARMLFDQGDSVGACTRLADAVATTPPGEVELRNQIDYLNSRCVGVDVDTGSVPAAAAPPAAKPPAQRPARQAPVGEPPAAQPPATQPAATKPPAAQTSRAPVQSAPAKPAATSVPGAPAAAGARQEFSVQVAAFSSHESAERIGQRLKDLGYDSRITSGAPPYRVRVGRYATREAADSVAAHLKTQHIDGYVTEAEPRR